MTLGGRHRRLESLRRGVGTGDVYCRLVILFGGCISKALSSMGVTGMQSQYPRGPVGATKTKVRMPPIRTNHKIVGDPSQLTPCNTHNRTPGYLSPLGKRGDRYGSADALMTG